MLCFSGDIQIIPKLRYTQIMFERQEAGNTSCLWDGKWDESSLRENYFSLCICYFVLFDFSFFFLKTARSYY